MGSVMPKVKKYIFLSIFCLLINMAVFSVNLIATPTTADINDFTGSDVYDVGGSIEEGNVEDVSANATLSDFALSTTSSFIPFFSIVSTFFVGDNLPAIILVFTSIVLLMIGAYQVLLLSAIVLNLIPKVLGSGWDV